MVVFGFGVIRLCGVVAPGSEIAVAVFAAWTTVDLHRKVTVNNLSYGRYKRKSLSRE